MKIGDLVRFAHEKDGGPVHRIVSVMSDGMVEIHDIAGAFAPHLFVAADDIADIPPVAPLPIYNEDTLIGWADKIDSRLGPISGRAADQLAVMLRATATRMRQLRTDRDDQDRALKDALEEAVKLDIWRSRLRDRIATRMNDLLCETKPDYDDSITGINAAWDVIRNMLAEDGL